MNPAVAAALAGAVAVAGRGMGWLSSRGALAAAIVGAAVLWGRGIGAGALLGFFFVTGSLLSRHIQAPSPQPQASRRTARQVLANGSWVAAAAIWPVGNAGWVVFGGALAAALADTWATEIGALSRTAPRSIISGNLVAPGTSGGITPLGTLGGVTGAFVMGLLMWLVTGRLPIGIATAAGGTAGALADSLLGATLQCVYSCESCGSTIEDARHDCGGAPIRVVRGTRWLNNDGVNLAATGIGGAVAMLVWMLH